MATQLCWSKAKGYLFTVVAVLVLVGVQGGFVDDDPRGQTLTESAPSYAPGNIILKWKQQPNEAEIGKLGIKFARDLGVDLGIQLYTITDDKDVPEKVDQLNADPRIEYAEADAIATVQNGGDKGMGAMIAAPFAA